MSEEDYTTKVANKVATQTITNAKNICRYDYILRKSFIELNPGCSIEWNWHLDAISDLIKAAHQGKYKRIIITMPPRYLKSHTISVALSAWLLAIDPTKKIIVASYNQQLANNFLSQVKRVMKSDWYTSLFPDTKIVSGGGLKNKILTSANGFRFATSINGTLTGEGADIIIADDPHKPLDILNKKSRKRVHEWFDNTFMSRLNNKRNGVVIVVMQRLHIDDLVGYLQTKPYAKNWYTLNLEMIASKDCTIEIDDKTYKRQQGSLLHESRDNYEDVEMLKQEVGESVFMAQYQQSPISCEGTIIKKSWIQEYEEESILNKHNKKYFISIDTAIKPGVGNDFTAITVWFYLDEKASSGSKNKASINDVPTKTSVYLEDVLNIKINYPNLISLTCELINKYRPQGIVIEDAASGSQLIQHLKNVIITPIFSKIPTRGKEIRLTFASLLFERKLVYFNKKMSEYYTSINQITNFPNVKNDDICDSVSMFINWFYDYYEPQIQSKDGSEKLKLRNL